MQTERAKQIRGESLFVEEICLIFMLSACLLCIYCTCVYSTHYHLPNRLAWHVPRDHIVTKPSLSTFYLLKANTARTHNTEFIKGVFVCLAPDSSPKFALKGLPGK